MKRIKLIPRISKAKRTNLRKQLLSVLIIVSIIPIIAIGTSTYITTIGKVKELSLNSLKTLSFNSMNNIDLRINSIDSIMKGVSSQPYFLVGLENPDLWKSLSTLRI